jgi:hypothetical protein
VEKALQRILTVYGTQPLAYKRLIGGSSPGQGATQMLYADMKIGTKVVIAKTIDIYPLGVFLVGLTGIVSEQIGFGMWVKLDTHLDCLNEWENMIEVPAPDTDYDNITLWNHFEPA